MLQTINNYNPSACTKLYIKSAAVAPGARCAAGINLKTDLFYRYCWWCYRSLASLAPQVQHVVLCENKNMTVSGVSPYTFARGSKHVKRLGVVNQTSRPWMRYDKEFAGLTLDVLDLRGNAFISGLTGSSPFNGAAIGKILLPDAQRCSAVLPYSADYGEYIGTNMFGTPCF
eukprot:4617-Heterococcus_DN1.PRE.2